MELCHRLPSPCRTQPDAKTIKLHVHYELCLAQDLRKSGICRDIVPPMATQLAAPPFLASFLTPKIKVVWIKLGGQHMPLYGMRSLIVLGNRVTAYLMSCFRLPLLWFNLLPSSPPSPA